MSTEHEVLVTVTVDHRRLRLQRRRAAVDRDAAAEKALLDEVQLLVVASRVRRADRGPSALPRRARRGVCARGSIRSARRAYATRTAKPGSAGRIRRACRTPVRSRCAPRGITCGSTARCTPRTSWPSGRDSKCRRTGWSRCCLHAGGVRTVAVHYEPVAPSRSQRQVDRETVKLASDEEQRTRTGFRIGARHRRAQSEVLEREAELVAGYGEFEFVGFVIVTARRHRRRSDRSCAEYEQAAAQAGLELRRLDGRHDLALACALPIGRGIAPRRFA